VALRAVWLSAAENDIFYLSGIELGRFAKQILYAMRREIVRARHIK
jgi:hypothetical protein